MTTKSVIQLITEGLEAKQNFANNLESLVNDYDIKDNVFCCDRGGEIQECSDGFFGQLVTYPNLEEAFRNLNIYTQGIRVYEAGYAVGNLYKNLSDANEHIIIDLQNSRVI